MWYTFVLFVLRLPEPKLLNSHIFLWIIFLYGFKHEQDVFSPGVVRFTCTQTCPIHSVWMMSWVQSRIVNLVLTCESRLVSVSIPRRTCHRFLRECIASWTTCASTDCAMEAFRREPWNYSSASPLPRSQTTAHPSQGRRSLLRWSCLAFRQGPAWDLRGGGVLWEPQGFVPQLLLCLFQLDFTRLPMIKRPKLLSRNSSQISWCDSERCTSWESEQCFPHCLLF